jgi:putative nucleotidyltransferase with HDIG domain
MVAGQGGYKAKIFILVILVVCIGLFHFLIPTDSHTSHMVHIILRKLYYLPPVVAGAWFGLRGAFPVTLAVSAIFSVHALLDWPGNYMEQANQMGELASFWVVGLVPGYLFDRQRQLLEEVANANGETLLALVSALDLRERNTRMHSQRVRDYAMLIAERLGVDERVKRALGFGALLHDVGKIAVPDAILLKPGNLSEEEWKEMRKHPSVGCRMVHRIGFLKEAAEIVRSHHEHIDGTGYPEGLRGNQIPLGARIFMVADVYDALTSRRPYRVPMTHEEAMAVIREERGRHFDPDVVDAFLRLGGNELTEIGKRYAEGGDLVEE